MRENKQFRVKSQYLSTAALFHILILKHLNPDRPNNTFLLCIFFCLDFFCAHITYSLTFYTEHALTYIMLSFCIDLSIYNQTSAFLEQCVLLSWLLGLGPFSFSAHPVSCHFPSSFRIHWPPRLSARCLQAAADAVNYPSALLLPGQFSCEPLASAAPEMKEGLERCSRCVGSA